MTDSAFVAIVMVDHAKAHELADQLAARGARPFVAANSDELYAKAGEELIDVLVIAHRLRSFLTGLEVVERLHADFAQPVTVLLAPESMREDPSVQRLGIFQVESPTIPAERLAELTLAAAEKSLLNRPFVCPRAQRLVSQAEGIQPLPPLILKTAVSLRDTPASPEVLIADLAADSMASAAVLKIANSSAIGRPLKTASVQEAIRFLGLSRTISAVLAAGLMQNQERLLSRAPKEVRRWYSRRSVLIASVAESFARNLEDLPPEAAYIYGLLQDSGVLILAQAHGERYVQLLERVEEIQHLRLHAEERRQWGTSHPEVTAAFLRILKLPAPMATVAGHHHTPAADVQGSSADQALVRVMQIGEAVANIADNPSPQRLMMLNFLLEHYRDCAPGLCSSTLTEAIQRVAELSKILGIPAPDDHVLAKLSDRVGERDRHTPDAEFRPYDSPTAQENPEDSPLVGACISNRIILPKKSKVLVLEDDPSIAKFISSALTRVGVEVVHAANVRGALSLVDGADAVLCDVHLGDEDGLTVVSQIRSNGFAGPVFIMSGDGRRSTVERACKAGISGYLLKPFTHAQLLEKLQKCPGLLCGPAIPSEQKPSSSKTARELQPA